MTNSTNDTINKIAANIRKYRKQKNLTQLDLCVQIDVSEEYISHIERARRTPSIKRLCKIAEALGVAPYELLK